MGGDERSFLDAAGLASTLNRKKSDRLLVLDPEVGPERPPDHLGLGAPVLLRPSFERLRLVLVEVAHLPNEAAAGERFPGRSWCRLALRHGGDDSAFRCLV